MARQEIASTFGDGLMMDLNPINTPKSVLTDCLNGTYITYNGNEFVLQNDMGNYKLKNCKLPTNFIPVGVKGYGDILYIVSYNPITKETEIGSYPAPQSIFTTGETEDALEATPDQLAPFVWDGEIEYPTIIKDNKKPIFIFTDSNEETYKLNPGDEFKFTGSVDIPTFIYQHLNFYIIDEDNKLYDIDDTQIYNENGTLISDNLRKVFWETPGWLAAQYDLYVPDRFNLNLRSLNVPEFLVVQSDKASSQAKDTSLDELQPDKGHFKVSMDLSSQTIITDKLFQTELDKHFGKELANTYDHLYIRYLIKRNKNTPEESEDDYGTFKGIVVSLDDGTTKDYTNGVIAEEGDYVYYDIPVWKHNYQDDIITAYNNVRPIWFCKNPNKKEDGSGDLDIANYHGVIELTAYPVIKYNGLTLKYTQFSTTQRFPLNTLKNSSDITIADSIYKWSVDDDSCTISFNINGPFINASNITGRYEIYRINLFKNPPKQDWNPDIATSSLDNPESYSKWTGLSKTINAKVEGVLEKSEDKNEEEFIERAINANIDDTNPNDFINQKKVLMCKGTLPNLVLYGQNTININWDSSNKYELTGYQNWYTNPDHTEEDGNKNWFVEDTSYVGYESKTKTIDFNKEGGIYMFRVILEQNGSQLAESQQVLIPSEVFNEWFGSIDNYLDKTTGITSSMWVGKWLDYLNVSVLINSIDCEFNNKSNNWKGFYYKIGNKDRENLSSVITSSTTIDWEKVIANILNTSTLTTDGYKYSSRPTENVQFIIDTNELLKQLTIDGNISDLALKQSLWNPIYSQSVALLDSLQTEIITNENGIYKLTKEIINNWNLLSILEQSSPVSSITSYPFFRNKNSIPTNGEWLGDSSNVGNGGNNDYGRALRLRLNVGGSTKYDNSAAGKGNYTDVNHSGFMGATGTYFLNPAGTNIGWITLKPNDNGNTWRTAFAHDSDGNGDNSYIDIMVEAYNTLGITTVFVAEQVSGSSNSVVFIKFSDENKRAYFMWALTHIMLCNNSESRKTYYYPQYQITITESEAFTVTKSKTNVSLKYLRTDDYFLFPKIDELYNLYPINLFNKTIIIKTELQKILPLSNNITINLPYIENADYRTYTNSISIGFTDYNDQQNTNIEEAKKLQSGIYLQWSNEKSPNVPTNYTTVFGREPSSEYTEEYKDWILEQIGKRNIANSYSSSNIGIKCSGETVKGVNKTGSGSDKSPGFIIGYYLYIDKDL